MIKWLVLICGLMIFNQVASQKVNTSNAHVERIKHFLDGRHWSDKDSILSFFFRDPKFYSRDSIDRQIDFDHWQILFYEEGYEFIIQGAGRNAYFFSLTEYTFEDWHRSPVLKKMNRQQLLQYLTLYNCKYHSDYSIDDYSNLSIERFGFGCGGAGSPSPGVSDMYEFVRMRNKKEIIAMATSLLPEIRTAGIAGLYFLQKLGVHLTPEETELLSIGRNSNIRIMYCSGCTVRESEEMRTFLNAEDLDHLFEWMVRFFNSTHE